MGSPVRVEGVSLSDEAPLNAAAPPLITTGLATSDALQTFTLICKMLFRTSKKKN